MDICHKIMHAPTYGYFFKLYIDTCIGWKEICVVQVCLAFVVFEIMQ